MQGKIVKNTILKPTSISRKLLEKLLANSPNMLNRDAIDILSVDFSTLAGSTGICIRDLMKKMSTVPILLNA
jgi:hypothetical protein